MYAPSRYSANGDFAYTMDSMKKSVKGGDGS